MATAFGARPSSLAGIRDPYWAYCLDEAVLDYMARLKEGQRLKPPKAADNRKLIDALEGGAMHGGFGKGRRKP